jgi:hypothetical protein
MYAFYMHHQARVYNYSRVFFLLLLVGITCGSSLSSLRAELHGLRSRQYLFGLCFLSNIMGARSVAPGILIVGTRRVIHMTSGGSLPRQRLTVQGEVVVMEWVLPR